MNFDSALNLYNPGRGLAGLGADLDLTSIISRGIDVVGSALAKAPSMYVSPTDPRYAGQYQVPPAATVMYPAATVMPTAMPKAMGSGLNVSTNTLIIGAVVLLAFMLGKR